MAKKDKFKEGMVAGAKPFEEKFEIVADKLEEIGENIKKRFEEQGEINEVVIDTLNASEKKRLYDLNIIMNLLDLSLEEKFFLLASLYKLSNDDLETNNLQKQFIRSIKSYLEIGDVQHQIDLSKIGNFDSIDVQKTILQVWMEFFFLAREDYTYLDDFEDLFSYFSVNKRGFMEIKEKIDSIYKAVGLEGLAEKYGYVVEEFEEKGQDGSILVKEGVSQLEDLYLNQIYKIDKENSKFIENKRVYIRSFINCLGQLTFNNCQIYFDAENYTSEIILDEGADIDINNSEIICLSYGEKPYIKVNSASLKIMGSKFIDCGNFIDADYDSKLLLEDCIIIDPNPGFIMSASNEKTNVKIKACVTKFKKTIRKINDDKLDDFSPIFSDIFSTTTTPRYIFSFKSSIIDNCVFDGRHSDIKSNIETKSFATTVDGKTVKGEKYPDLLQLESSIIEISEGTIKNSYFMYIDKCIEKGFWFESSLEILDTKFYRCQNIIEGEKINVNKCQFVECNNKLIIGKEINIEFTEFFNITGDLESSFSRKCGIFKFEKFKNTSSSKMSNCIFDGITVKDGFLVSAYSHEKIKGYAIYIENCIFKNCRTEEKNDELIKKEDHYFGLFNKIKHQTLVNVYQCTGLDQVNIGLGYNPNIKVIIEGSGRFKIIKENKKL